MGCTPMREGPPGRRIDGTNSSFGPGSSGSGGNVASFLEDGLLGREDAESFVDWRC